MTRRFQRMRPCRLLPVLAALLSLFFPSQSSAFVRRDLSPDASFLTPETCRNVPVKFRDPMGTENEIVATVGDVNVGRWPSASDYATYNVRINGGGVLDPGAFEVYAGNAGAEVAAAVEINKQAAALLVPRPDQPARLIPEVGRIAADPSRSLTERSLARLGIWSSTVLVGAEASVVAGVAAKPLTRLLGRFAAKETEVVVERAVLRTVEREAAKTPLAGSIRNVNPLGGDMNCVNCSIATDATLARTPASALGGGPQPVSVLEQQFGGQFAPVSGPMEIGSTLSRSGNGARGIVYGANPAGDVGHVWNAVNQGGTVRFLDGQAGGLGVNNFDYFTDFRFLPTSPGVP